MTIAQRLRHKRADVRRQAKKEAEMHERLREEIRCRALTPAFLRAPATGEEAGTSIPYWVA